MTDIKILKDKNNNTIYPLTSTEGVFTPNGESVSVVVNNLQTEIDSLELIKIEETNIKVNKINI